jgi:hypothetical protein
VLRERYDDGGVEMDVVLGKNYVRELYKLRPDSVKVLKNRSRKAPANAGHTTGTEAE